MKMRVKEQINTWAIFCLQYKRSQIDFGYQKFFQIHIFWFFSEYIARCCLSLLWWMMKSSLAGRCDGVCCCSLVHCFIEKNWVFEEEKIGWMVVEGRRWSWIMIRIWWRRKLYVTNYQNCSLWMGHFVVHHLLSCYRLRACMNLLFVFPWGNAFCWMRD